MTTNADALETARHLLSARTRQGLSLSELAARTGLKRQQIHYFETGSRRPSLAQLLRIARALHLPLQWFLTGSVRPGLDIPNIAIELRRLGLIDLWVETTVAPGAFRHPEEIVTAAIAGEEPQARILEGVPALLAWNRWRKHLLLGFARANGTVYRLAWLADIALTIDRMGGFPGGCPAKEHLGALVKRIPRPPKRRSDDLGRPAHEPSASPVWKRWRINYAADLATFRRRAEKLVALAKKEDYRRAEGEAAAEWEE